ncbi:MAG: RidA/YER057c/UK114 superfamily, group 6, partial [uncultured Friedmanniella sp.]
VQRADLFRDSVGAAGRLLPRGARRALDLGRGDDSRHARRGRCGRERHRRSGAGGAASDRSRPDRSWCRVAARRAHPYLRHRHQPLARSGPGARRGVQRDPTGDVNDRSEQAHRAGLARGDRGRRDRSV